MKRKRYIQPGEKVRVEVPHSEVCIYMRVAGQVIDVEILPTEHGFCAQLWRDGREFSSPVTDGEAGVYYDEEGPYVYEVVSDAPFVAWIMDPQASYPNSEGYLGRDGQLTKATTEAATFGDEAAAKSAVLALPQFKFRHTLIPYAA